MLFTSAEFLFLLAGLLALYWLLPTRPQNVLLLVASYLFYAAWDPRFLSLILISTAVDYASALRIAGARERGDMQHARRWVIASVTVNLSILGVFKYYDFFASSAEDVLRLLGFEPSPLTLGLILPVGISFYTFQTMGYTIDVYRRRVRPTRNVLDFALFVAFFPQLVAGPIERARALLPQLAARRSLDTGRISEGACLILSGFFKKLFIADNLAPFQRWGFFGGAQDLLDVYLLAVASAVRIYCDFSAYTDIARGTAKLLGIELSRNFDMPFFATTPADLWRRWHMTLTQWLTDYLYLPVRKALMTRGFGRENAISVATFVTFTSMGLWHGATWGYVLWGMLWGIILVAHRAWTQQSAPSADDAPAPVAGLALRRLAVFHAFAFSLVLTTGSLDVPMRMIATAFSGALYSPLSMSHAATLAYYIAPLVVVQLVRHSRGGEDLLPTLPAWGRTAAYVTMILLLMTSGAKEGEEFVYFQF